MKSVLGLLDGAEQTLQGPDVIEDPLNPAFKVGHVFVKPSKAAGEWEMASPRRALLDMMVSRRLKPQARRKSPARLSVGAHCLLIALSARLGDYGYPVLIRDLLSVAPNASRAGRHRTSIEAVMYTWPPTLLQLNATGPFS